MWLRIWSSTNRKQRKEKRKRRQPNVLVYNSFLWLKKTPTNLFFYSTRGHKIKVSITGVTSKCWQAGSFYRLYEEVQLVATTWIPFYVVPFLHPQSILLLSLLLSSYGLLYNSNSFCMPLVRTTRLHSPEE